MFSQLKLLSKEKMYLVFDFDLTIAKIEMDWTNWHKTIAEIYAKFEQNHGYKRGINPHNFYNQMVEKYGSKLVKAVQKFNADYEQQHLQGFTPNPELIAFIKQLNNKNLYIYSSNAKETIERGLQELQIDHCFKQIIAREDVHFLKPIPEGFTLIKDFKINKDLFLMIGDSQSDQEVAKIVGIDFCRCKYFI